MTFLVNALYILLVECTSCNFLQAKKRIMKRSLTQLGCGALRVKLILLMMILLCNYNRVFAAGISPVISSVTPLTGIPVSGVITITGSGFNDTVSRNVVFFGSVSATVSAASATSLTVVVPVGAVYTNVSVMNKTTRLTAYSADFFLPTFNAAPYVSSSRGFKPKITLPIIHHSGPNALTYHAVSGDIDGDGLPDLVVGSYDSALGETYYSAVEIYRNISANGVVAYEAPVACTASYGVHNVKLADLDGDGKLDIIVASSGSGRVSCIRNKSTPGNISMAMNLNLRLTSGAFETVIADFDGDGKLDIAAAEYQKDSVMIYKNIIATIPVNAFTSSGTFKPYYVAFKVGTGPASIAAADMDGDGKPDLVVSNNGSNSISILKNNSIVDSFIFQNAVNVAAGDGPQQLLLANVNNDGKPDVIVSSYNTNSLLIFRNQATSGAFNLTTLAAPVNYDLANGANGIAVGDINGDGKMDIVASKYLADSFTVLKNTSVGSAIDASTFTKDNSYYVGFGNGPLGITIADVDGDTKPDVITANNASSSVSIFKSFAMPSIGNITGQDSICAGSGSTYTSAHGMGATAYWSVTNGHAAISVGASDTLAILTGISAGIDTVICRVVYLSDTSIVTRVVAVKPLPVAGNIMGPAQVCALSSITLTDPLAGAGYWSSTDTNVIIVSPVSGVVTGKIPGSASVIYTATSFSCGNATATHSVTVLNLPDAGVISGPGGTCAGSSFSLTVSVSGGIWINLFPAVATDAPSGINDVITGQIVGADTLLYIVTTPSCGSDTALHSVGIIDANFPLPVIGDTSLCPGSTNTFTNAATGGIWSSADPSVAQVDPLSGVVTGIAAGMTTISYIVTYGCGPVDTVISVTVHPGPSVDPITDNALCNGSVLTVPFSSPVAGATFTWTNSDTSIGLGVTGTGSSISFTAMDTASAGTTADIAVIASANGCVGLPANFHITVHPTATLTGTAFPASVCSGSTFHYMQLSDRPGTTFSWSRNIVSGISNTSANDTGNITEALVNTTPDSVQVVYIDTLNYNGCKTFVPISVYVKATPLLASSTVAPVCDSSLFSFIPSSATAGASFNWTRVAVPGISDAAASDTGAIAEWLNNTSSDPVTVTYFFTTTASGCSGSQNVVLTVAPTAVLSTLSDAGTICDSALFTYVPASVTSGVTFSWTRDAITGIANGASSGADTISEYLFNTTNSPITVSYKYQIHNLGCIDSQTVTVTVNPRAYLTSTLTPPAICSDDTFNYGPVTNISSGGVTILWSRTTILGISNLPANGVGDPNEILYNTSPAFVDVPYTYTTTYLSCPFAQTVTVRVQPKPILVGATRDTVCSGTPYYYLPTPPFTGITYAWVRPAVVGIDPATASGGVAIYDTLHNSSLTRIDVQYIYTLTANGCPYTQNYTLTVDPAVAPAPNITTHSPNALCLNTMFQNFGANIASADTAIEYRWSATNATLYATGASQQYALINFDNSGIAAVILSANIKDVNCISNDTFMVNVSATPAPQPVVYYINNQFVCLPADMDSYQWGYDNAQLDSVILTGETNQDYNDPSPDPGKYYWVITTEGGCLQKTYYKVPTGIKNINDMSVVMNLYPNPAAQMLTIELPDLTAGVVDIQVQDMMGRVISTVKMMNNKAVLNVSGLASGAYLVACYNSGIKLATARFIKD